MSLSLEDRIVVDIKDYTWIPVLQPPRSGPQPRILLPVKTIIELINLKFKVIIPEDRKAEILLLLSAYNEVARKTGDDVAEVAEDTLRAELKDERAKRQVRREINPFVQSGLKEKLARTGQENANLRIPDALRRQGLGKPLHSSGDSELTTPLVHELLLPKNPAPPPVQLNSEYDDMDLG